MYQFKYFSCASSAVKFKFRIPKKRRYQVQDSGLCIMSRSTWPTGNDAEQQWRDARLGFNKCSDGDG